VFVRIDPRQSLWADLPLRAELRDLQKYDLRGRAIFLDGGLRRTLIAAEHKEKLRHRDLPSAIFVEQEEQPELFILLILRIYLLITAPGLLLRNRRARNALKSSKQISLFLSLSIARKISSHVRPSVLESK